MDTCFHFILLVFRASSFTPKWGSKRSFLVPLKMSQLGKSLLPSWDSVVLQVKTSYAKGSWFDFATHGPNRLKPRCQRFSTETALIPPSRPRCIHSWKLRGHEAARCWRWHSSKGFKAVVGDIFPPRIAIWQSWGWYQTEVNWVPEHVRSSQLGSCAKLQSLCSLFSWIAGW